ncbi:MAG: PilZ domain-containing protein [Bdellovibrionales bacterium]|nr:PilZ domain-containing protein [Bdellovibrionales bacterium]
MNEQSQVPQPRIPLKLDVDFRRSYGRSSSLGVLKNISLTGAFLEHELEGAATGDKLQITFKVGGRIRKVNALIVWTNEVGSGVKFLPTNGRDVQIVDDLMYFVESNREGRRSLLGDIFKETA